eukprot:GSMAST32.ASY1.ANO1.1958.1 assembled CDS
MTSLKILSEHNQVMDSYGKKCNSKFLLHYGFTIECIESDDKCQNELDITLSLDETDPLFDKRSYYVNKSRGYRVTMNHVHRGTQDAMAYLRVAVATSDELTSFSRGFQHSVISAQNELAALLLMAQFSTEVLSGYPKTMSEDNAALADDGLDPFCNKRHAIIVVRGEKQICHFYIKLAQAASQLLKLPTMERKLLLSEKYTADDDISRFLTATCRSLLCKGL